MAQLSVTAAGLAGQSLRQPGFIMLLGPIRDRPTHQVHRRLVRRAEHIPHVWSFPRSRFHWQFGGKVLPVKWPPQVQIEEAESR